jgi:hypothetical protein
MSVFNIHKLIKNVLLVFLLAVWAAPLWAGSEVLVRLESTLDKNAWVNLDALVQDGQLKVSFLGPWSRGALIYNQKTSAITIVDDTNKVNVPISQADQNAFKLMSYLGSGRIKGLVDKSDDSVRLAYQLAEQNARALFNGSAALTGKNIRMDGFNCVLYEARASGLLNRQEWMTSREATGITVDEYDTLWSLTRQMIDLLEYEMTSLGADTQPFLQNHSSLEFPVHVTLYTDGKISSRFKVVKILHRVLKPADFEPPANYQTLSLLKMVE